MTTHIANLTAKSHQTLYALRLVKSHGLYGKHLHEVTQALLHSRLSYAISAWFGFANQENLMKLQRVIDRAERWGLGGNIPLPSIEHIAHKSDVALFSKVLRNPSHILHSLLPPERFSTTTKLRKRPHNHQLALSSTTAKKNFLTRMLFLNSYQFLFSSLYRPFSSLVILFFLFFYSSLSAPLPYFHVHTPTPP